jgi:predicted HAD superfamily hydrolase
MVFYHYEVLANLKIEEFEKVAEATWKYNSLKRESIIQKIMKKLAERFENKDLKTKNCCVAS